MIQTPVETATFPFKVSKKPQFQNTRKGLFCCVNSDLVIIKLC